MKKLLFVLPLGLAGLVDAQTYRPMLVEGVVWSNAAFAFNTGFYSTTVGADTLVDGLVFKRMEFDGDPVTTLSAGYAMREDTAARKVYVHFEGATHLAYDFSVQLGDTLEVFGESLVSPPTQLIMLDSISSLSPPGTVCTMAFPRFYYFRDVSPGWFRRMVWLEGVGSLSLTPDGASTGHGFLTCHHDTAGNLTFEDTTWMQYAFDSCDQVGSYNGLVEQGLALSASVQPNPARDQLAIRFFGGAVLNGEFVLYDGAGRIVQRERAAGRTVEFVIDISERPPGVYLLSYSDAKGQRWQQTVIKE